MKIDFTFETYSELLKALQRQGFCFQTVEGFVQGPLAKAAILRHDVDLLPQNALRMAQLEHGMGVLATYYFRAVPETWDEGVIREIAGLGHEVGYHYENLSAASKRRDDSDGWMNRMARFARDEWMTGGVDGRTEKLYELAYEDFRANLARLRELVPVTTVCMHGSPLSGIDNLDLLRKYDFKSLGIVGEPYLDFDFDQMFYLTDTGRRWDGEKVSVRDKVGVSEKKVRRFEDEKFRKENDRAQRRRGAKIGAESSKLKGEMWPSFHSTFDIIAAIEAGRFPEKVMMTVHPQRWHDRSLPWLRELVFQSVKNLAKRILIAVRAGKHSANRCKDQVI